MGLLVAAQLDKRPPVQKGFRERLAALGASAGSFEWLDTPQGGSRWHNFRLLQKVLADSLDKADYPVKGKNVAACHRDFEGFHCDQGHKWAVPVYTCHIRLCPFEMRARSMRAQKRFGQIVGQMGKARYLVLSERNVPMGELADGIRQLWADFTRLRKSPIWKGVKGCVVALEVTFNRFTQSWHPHLNILYDGPYLPQQSIVSSWVAATEGRGQSAWIQKVDDGTIRELLKYITKLVDFIDVPEAVGEFIEATRRVRFVKTYGSMYGVKIEDEAAGSRFCCPDCGSQRVTSIGDVSRQRIYWDVGGQVRFVFDSS